MTFTSHGLKDLKTFHTTKIDNFKSMCVGKTPKSQTNKYFPLDSHHPMNKWCTASVKELKEMLNNHDI